MSKNITPKKKFQEHRFKHLEEFYDHITPQEASILLPLRKLILDCIPGCTEYLSYNVPYFKKHRGICFLWPQSVTWGGVKQKGAVRFGFIQGHLLQDEWNFLEKGQRKQVFWKDFDQLNEEDIVLINTFLFEAAAVDDALNERSKKVKPKSPPRK